MKKNGFTLIELMVVIVIIGILAAIAIPKLFGMTAKAKAAEVGPAAGTWGKCAAAYYAETASMGDWDVIGYKAPGDRISGSGISVTNNFTYQDIDFGAATSVSHWQATAKDLSVECDGMQWKAHSDGITTVVDQLGCSLTPNFDKLQ